MMTKKTLSLTKPAEEAADSLEFVIGIPEALRTSAITLKMLPYQIEAHMQSMVGRFEVIPNQRIRAERGVFEVAIHDDAITLTEK